jgi:MFS-type transporter involved in bile tolerance (Atg22 family)
LCGKASAVVGPFIYGIVADLAGDRVAALCIGMFFAAGLFILQGVKEPERGVVRST